MQLNWVKANLLSIVFVIRSLNAAPNAIVLEISFLLPKKGEKNIVWSKRKKCLYLSTYFSMRQQFKLCTLTKK